MSTTVTSAEMFEAMPARTVVMDYYGHVYEKVKASGASHRGWETIGSEIDVHHREFGLPATVLYTPGEESR